MVLYDLIHLLYKQVLKINAFSCVKYLCICFISHAANLKVSYWASGQSSVGENYIGASKILNIILVHN